MRQWMLRITAYADRLAGDLDMLQWPESLKEMQRNWIGRSVGADVDFEVVPPDEKTRTQLVSAGDDDDADDLTITVFTTRPDTLFGATYMVLAPEHPLVDRLTVESHRETIEAYREMIADKSDRDRIAQSKEKTGVFIGACAINPVNQAKIPIYIADYVLMGYGTGAIMAVPAHDERDYEFAKQNNLPIQVVVTPPPGRGAPAGAAYVDEGIAVASGFLDGLPTPQAKERMIRWLEDEGLGRRSIKYKLRDWLFSRQRYWGEPFPILLDGEGNPYALEEAQLPLTLPELADFKPTGTPEGPLSKAKEWLAVKDARGTLRRETNTMPQWAGSCWYYLRYIDPRNEKRFVDPEKERYWMPVDLYVGGVEHAVLHLLYSRFWHKVLFDLGHVSTPEPFGRLVNQGLILGPMEYTAFFAGDTPVSVTELRDLGEEATPTGTVMAGIHAKTGDRIVGRQVGEDDLEKRVDGYYLKAAPQVRVDARTFKMSKARGNVVNPDDIVRDYGADTFRLYEMYMGPLEAQKPWNTRDIVGMSRFLNAVWRNLVGADESEVSNPKSKISDGPIPDALDRQLHRAIKKVGEDIDGLRFNTAIAELIKLNNEMTGMSAIPRALVETFTLLLAPFAPHIAEEIWERLGHHKSLARRPWPTFDTAKLAKSTLELPVQVNGKLRDKITVPADAAEIEILTAAENAEKVRPWLEGKTIRKKLYVPKKLVNLVVSEQ
jgi:leucyl-tRNA synthetase